MDIEFLFWAGSPSHPEANRLVDDVIAEQDLDVEVKVREMRTQAEADEVGFPGSQARCSRSATLRRSD